MPTLPPPPVTTAAARLALAHRHERGGLCGDPEAVADARRDLLAAKLVRQINAALTADAPLTLDQRNYLASLLASGRPA